ncbi:MAG TPA: ribosome maturation factor RimP [Acidimicrobiales bacterium]|nr:ribosome maturation factor RimP [Acidimicrobiales bacterium]
MTDQHMNERVRAVVEGPLADAGFEVVDVERQGPMLRVTVDLLVGAESTVDLPVGAESTVDLPVGAESGRRGGIDLDGVTEATRLVSDLLDRHDLVGERTTLEVSSPGIERPLRTPGHFRRFVGTEVAIRLRPQADGDRRVTGALEAADDDGVTVAGRRLAYADIDRARTVFVWPASGQKAQASGPRPKKIGTAS